jgi:hypothetical protein
MLKPFKIKSDKSSDFHNIRFEILDIDGDIIKFLLPFHAKIKVDCLFNIILIDIGDKIVVSHSGDTFSYIFTSIWANQSLDLLIQLLNNVLGSEELGEDIFTINEQSKLVNIHPKFRITECSQRIKYLLGVDKNNNLRFKPSHGSPYIVIRYRQNTNHYNKILDNPIVDNQDQSITVNFLFIRGLFMLKPFKIKSDKSSNFHNIRFEILDIDGEIIKFFSSFHVRMKLT